MKKRISQKVNLIGIGVALTFLGINVLGQVGNGTSTPNRKETDNNADQNLKSVARVNPSTLAMEMSLPLASYPGRNGNSLPVGFNYSSKVWRMESRFQWWYWLNTQPRYVTDVYASFAERSAAGWTSNLLPPRIDTSSVQFYKEDGQPWNLNIFDQAGLNSSWQNILSGFANNSMMPCGTQCSSYRWDGTICGGGICWHYYSCASYEIVWCDTGGGGPTLPEPPPPIPLFYIKRLQVAMSDGSTHEFRASDTPVPCGTNQAICAPDTNGTYLAVDGSGMKLVRESTGSTLYLPDGSKYLFNPTSQNVGGIYATSYIDTNGNKLTFSSTTANNQTTNKWTDTLGREINDPMPHNWLAQTQIAEKKTVNLPGLSGQTQEYEITWANLKPLGCETDETLTCVGANNVTGGALEYQTDKLYYDTKYFCRGNISDNLVTQSNGEVLFPEQESGIRPCSSFDVQRNANGEIILDGSGNAIPIVPRFNPVVLSEVKLPNGKKYVFKYNRFGEITKITYPTGSYETFVYSYITPMSGAGSPAYDQTNRGVTERRVYDFVGGALQQTWKYSAALDYANGSYKITTKSSTGNDANAEVLRSERYIAPTYSDGSNFGFNSQLGGMPKEERIYDELGNLRSRHLTEYVTKDSTYASRDARVKRIISATIENGQALASLSETDYDESGSTDPQHFSHLNAKQKKAYHYAVISQSLAGTGTLAQIAAYFDSSMLANIAETDYSYDPNYKARGIASLPIETRVLNPSNTSDVLAKSQMVYDEAAYQDFSYTTTNWENPNSTFRGNVTTARTWVKETDTWLETHAMHDNFGNVRKFWDASGDAAKFVETQYSPTYMYAYPTSVTTPAPATDPNDPHSTNQTSTASTTYNFNTGLPLTVTDDFGQVTATEYNDPLLRPTRVISPNGQQTITEYGDVVSNIYLRVKKQIDENNWEETTTYNDGLGRAVKSVSKDSQGDVWTETRYDLMGRISQVTNPYRIGDPKLWNLTQYDEVGRVKEKYAPAADGQTGNNIISTRYSVSTVPSSIGTVLTTIDSSGKKQRSITNALDQLIRVDEATNSGGTETTDLGSLEGPNQPTHYTYSPQGKIVKVQQSNQIRYFMYDSLERLIRIRQPEQDINPNLNLTDPVTGNSEWTAALSYDALGNILTITDAKGTVITNNYDRLSRIITKTFSDGTPQVDMFYDNLQFGKGKLVKVSNSISTTEVLGFDNVGNILSQKQTTDGQSYTTSYKYNLFGTTTEITYPSGRVVKNFLDNDGDLSLVSSRANQSSPFKTYASNISYSAHDVVNSIQLGNGRWESIQFNSRLQTQQINLGTNPNGSDLFKLSYDYGAVNTGNITGQTITVPSVGSSTGFTAIQTYTYDSMNRLKNASETVNNIPTWNQSFVYDRFSNRRFDPATTTTFLTSCPIVVCNPDINLQNNRLVGYGHDANGNIQTDAEGKTFIYDGQNRQIEVRDAQGNWIVRYFYDGDGRRIKKLTPSEVTIFVYDVNNNIIGEYSNLPTQNPHVNYITSDHLDTPRINTDRIGNVIARHDYLPFGKELYTEQRTQNLKYLEDSVRQKFTQKERDSETGLDYFGARYYSPNLGRFTTTDPVHLTEKRLADPQQLNLYAYVRNNPLILYDPNGEDVHVKLSKEPVGKTTIRLVQPDPKSDPNIPDTVEIDVYRLEVRDDATKKISVYLVTRDAPNLASFEKGRAPIKVPLVLGIGLPKGSITISSGTPDKVNIANYTFEPRGGDGNYILNRIANYSGTGPAYLLTTDGKNKALPAEPNGSPLRTDPNTATDILFHVGGQYTSNITGLGQITGSQGCFTLCNANAGNAGVNAFDKDIQSRVEANRKARTGTTIRANIQRRTNVRWTWQILRPR